MDFREYFSLADDASLRDLKRAYAKKLKVTSPETDPDGFQHLRNVYEYAQQSIKSAEAQPEEAQEALVENEETEIVIASTRNEAVVNDGFADSNVDEIIRSLRNGLEQQALAYLDVMRDSGEIFSLDISSELECEGINYLLKLKETDAWPTQFVSDYVRTLNLTEQAKTNAELDQILDMFYKRSTMAMNSWTSEQYDHDCWAKDAVHKVMVEIRQCLFDQGQDAAIELLDKRVKEKFFNDDSIKYYFVNNFLTDIDNYFPGVFPYRLAIEIENIFKFSVNFNHYSDAVKQGYNHYLERRKASEVRNERWRYFSDNTDAKSLAAGLLFGFIGTEYVRKDALSVANELDLLCSNLKKDDVYYFEIGGDAHVDSLKQWLLSAKGRKLSAFKSSLSLKDRRLNPFAFIKDYRNITSDSVFFTFLSLIAACYGITAFNVFSKGQDYVGVMNVTLVFCCVLIIPLLMYYLRCLYYSRWDSYFYREVSLFRYNSVYKIVWGFIAAGLLLNIIFGTHNLSVFISSVLLLFFSKIIFKWPQLTTLLLVSAVPWIGLIGLFSKYEFENPFLLGTVSVCYLSLLVSFGYDKAKAAGWQKSISGFFNFLFYLMIAIFSVFAAGAFVLGALSK